MKTQVATSTGAVEEAIRRAAGYELLARCFAYPDESALDGMREVAGLTGHLLANGPLHELLEALALASPDELEGGYVECFTLTTSTECPTFETAYICTDPGQQTAKMADLNGFYRAFGVDAGETSFRPDDISVELEFMAFLCRKEAYAIEHLGAARVAQARKAQRLFLEEHLGRWAPALGARTARSAISSPFYRALGGGLNGWIETDTRAVKAKVRERADGPQLPWPDRSERGGPTGASAHIVELEQTEVVR